MSKENQDAFVANGGWIETTCRSRPKTTLFTILAGLWVIPSLGAICILLYNHGGWMATATSESSRMRFDDWIAIGLLVAQVVFAALAIRHKILETGGRRVLIPNPDVDPRKLY